MSYIKVVIHETFAISITTAKVALMLFAQSKAQKQMNRGLLVDSNLTKRELFVAEYLCKMGLMRCVVFDWGSQELGFTFTTLGVKNMPHLQYQLNRYNQSK